MKRLWSVGFLVMAMMCIVAFGGTETRAENFEDYEYEMLEDGTVEITGYTGMDMEITVPDTIDGKSVTRIGEKAFYDCNGLKRISLPEGVTTIGDYAFSECSGLESISLPEGVIVIGDNAFERCMGLKSISLPESVTEIGKSAFHLCRGLENISLPEGMKRIRALSFYECRSLKSISLPESVIEIGKSAFFNCRSLGSINVPEGVTTIEDKTFWYCSSLEKINLPEGVTTIGNNAFYKCNSLEKINLPEGVTTIGNAAFYQCSSLEKISLPEGVTTIGDNAFFDCSSLESISIETANKNYASQGGVLFSKDLRTLICYPGGKKDVQYEVPEGVTTIGELAFFNCSSLGSISLPEGVATIGDDTFANCSSLENISVEVANKNYASKDGVLFSKDLKTLICYPCGKKDVQYEVPDGVTCIEFPSFYNCGSLKRIKVPDSVKELWRDVVLPDFDVKGVIICCNPDSYVYRRAVFLGFATEPYKDMDKLSEEMEKPVPDNLKPGAKVKISGNIYCILKSNAVAYCAPLHKDVASTVIPAEIMLGGITYKVTKIKANAFKNCKKLKKVKIGKNISKIGKKAFYGCKKLKNITINTAKLTKKSVGKGAFEGIYAKAVIKVPKKQLKAYKTMLRARGIGKKAKVKK